ncbi:MAG: hypothetical protein JO212_02930 [Acetobacteraceae bacterium]|nr:hypothetical protein [Acetobacteraceae bacterium]
MKLEGGLRFFAPGQRGMRWITALAAGFSIVLQALVFAWHQHDLPFASRGATVIAVAASASEIPFSAEHDCPICFAIAHHGAVLVELFASPPPSGRVLQQRLPATLGDPAAPYLLFRSRAPPRV